MTRIDVLSRWLRRKHWSSGVRVEIEELITLVSNKVVATVGSTAGDPDTLRHLKGCFQSRMIYRCDAIDPEADTQDNERRLEPVICIFL